MSARLDEGSFARRLRRELSGDVLFDSFNRGRYASDASIYQIDPIGVVVPRSDADVVSAVQICAAEGVPLIPRGAGTSQGGQTIGRALIVDVSKHLNGILEFDPDENILHVQPGIVLDQLNKQLRKRGMFFPVDPSTASRATIGGMAGNNSSGARSLRYGTMVHNVRAIDAVLADGSLVHFGHVSAPPKGEHSPIYRQLIQKLRAIGARDAEEIVRRFPKLLRRVGGYNIDMLAPDDFNMAQLLVGSEGTLAFFTSLLLDVKPIPAHRVLGICHFPTFYQSMDATRHLVALEPVAVELVDRTMIELAREIPIFRPTMDRFVRGQPGALLLVEFEGEDRAQALERLDELDELMGDLGFPGAVNKVVEPGEQDEVWTVRKAGLDIMMSTKGDAKPISIIEDCAVGLADLAEYTSRLTDVFEKYGTKGTWYAHASVGCLHVRPVLNLKNTADRGKLRAIAEETFAIVREYKGSHSGEHGDGIVRSEFHEAMFGERIVRAFEDVKDAFDPKGLFNPGKIVRPLRMDDPALLRYGTHYTPQPLKTQLDWSEWNGLAGAAEMCNNNGACRKADGVMCPSFMATGDEEHVTRGRANALRLALSGQLGADAFTSDDMYATLDLCVGCKACKRECPTGVDMAKMKIEFLHHYRSRHGFRLKDRLVAHLPRYARMAARLAPLLNARNGSRFLRALSERIGGFSARRSLPSWRSDYFRETTRGMPKTARAVVLWVDTFTAYFEPENAHAAIEVLQAGGYEVILPPLRGGRGPCCGRTFLASGMIAQARQEAQRTLAILAPYVAAGLPILGLEPSCLLTTRDEFPSLLPGAQTATLAARSMLLEEFLAAETRAGRLSLPLHPLPGRALVHGHCHQKAFAAMSSVVATLQLVPQLEVETIDASCCGMAGTFGYEAEHYDISMRMAEHKLLPAVRSASMKTLIVADGTSCRHQIADGAQRDALHVARVLQRAL